MSPFLQFRSNIAASNSPAVSAEPFHICTYYICAYINTYAYRSLAPVPFGVSYEHTGTRPSSVSRSRRAVPLVARRRRLGSVLVAQYILIAKSKVARKQPKRRQLTLVFAYERTTSISVLPEDIPPARSGRSCMLHGISYRFALPLCRSLLRLRLRAAADTRIMHQDARTEDPRPRATRGTALIALRSRPYTILYSALAISAAVCLFASTRETCLSRSGRRNGVGTA